MTRDQIIDLIVCEQEDWTVPYADIDGEAIGEQYLRQTWEKEKSFLAEVKTILTRRLTEREYLTCAEFDVLDVKCCDHCHSGYPHWDMWDITLPNGRHAFVCDPFHHVLMRKVRGNLTPEQEELIAQLNDVFGQSPDPEVESLNAASLVAESDDERLRLCLKYVYHVYGRKRNDRPLEAIIESARDLLGTKSAIRAKLGEAIRDVKEWQVTGEEYPPT